jgi:hypothetical protein
MSACLAALGPLVLLAQNTIRVPEDAPTIQAAIDTAQAFDTVLVATGTYVETIDFLGKPITVRSESGSDVTIIDGGDGSHLPVVSFRNGEGPESVLRGFTVTGGDNRSADFLGGGISCAGDTAPYTSPTIAECVITLNRTGLVGGGVAGNPVLEDCKISANIAFIGGGGVWGAPVMRRCLVSGNLAYDGGGLHLIESGALSVLIEDCVVIDNMASDGARGGGVNIASPGAVLRRCLVARNYGVGYLGQTAVSGAGVCVEAFPPPLLERCTIVGNRVKDPSLYSQNVGGLAGAATLVDCIVRANDHVDLHRSSEASYSNVEGGFPGIGNLDLDPLFVDAPNGDYRLAAGSPCIDTGDPKGALDLDGTRADQGAFYYPQANVIPRNGSGVNRACFSSLTPPFVGSTWNARVDATGHAGASISGFLVVTQPLPTPLTTLSGELLIQVGSVRIARYVSASTGAFDDFAVPIPLDTALVGFAAYAQAFVLGGATELCNALDLKLGN